MVILWGYDAEDIMRSYGVIIAMMDRWEILEVHGGLCLGKLNIYIYTYILYIYTHKHYIYIIFMCIYIYILYTHMEVS